MELGAVGKSINYMPGIETDVYVHFTGDEFLLTQSL